MPTELKAERISVRAEERAVTEPRANTTSLGKALAAPLPEAVMRLTDPAAKASCNSTFDATVPFTSALKLAMSDMIGADKASAIRNRYRLLEKPADLGVKGSRSTVTRVVHTSSDRHMASGVDPVTKKMSPLEDSPPENDIQEVRVGFHHQRMALRESTLGEHARNERLEITRRLERQVLGDPTAKLTAFDWEVLKAEKSCQAIWADMGDRIDFMKMMTRDDAIPFPDGMSDDYNGPKNTPANAVAQLQIAAKGHPTFFPLVAATILSGNDYAAIVGNHDEALMHPYVWQGFKDLVALAAQKLGANDAQIASAMTRLHRDTFKVYGDALHDHGHRYIDQYNMLDDPLGPLVNPQGPHEEMPSSFGFYGVRGGKFGFPGFRGGYTTAMSKFPVIEHLSGKERTRWMLHPKNWPDVIRIARGFIFAFRKGGYKVSRAADIARDLANIRKVVDTTDIVARFNADLPAGVMPVDAGYVEGFMRTMYFAGPTPFLSNFKEGTGIISRLATYVKLRLTGKLDERTVDQILVDSTAAVQKYALDNGGPIINRRVAGHTHDPKQEVHLTDSGAAIDYFNDGSGLYQHTDRSSSFTFAHTDHGVVVTEMGTTEAKPWSSTRLDRIVDENATMIPGNLVEIDRQSPAKIAGQAQRVINRFMTHSVRP